MKRVKLIVAYDGTNYCGWQIQPNGITIEQVLNENLSKLLGEEITVTGASRTDSGVHSMGNVAIFDTETRMPADKISFALNQRLPEDIVVQDSCEVPSDWHPRYQVSRKTYEYRILNRTFRMPNRRLDTYFYHHKLDVDKMKQAASYLVGEHDFKSFCAVGAQVKTTTRTFEVRVVYPWGFESPPSHQKASRFLTCLFFYEQKWWNGRHAGFRHQFLVSEGSSPFFCIT